MPSRDSLLRRATVLSWCIGIVEIVLFTLLALACLRLGAMSADEFVAYAASTKMGITELRAWHELMPRLALAAGLCGVMPGVALVVSGFGLRRGSRTAAALVLMLAGMQIVVAVSLLVLLAGRAFSAGDPPMVTLSVLLCGTPITVLILLSKSVWPLVQSRNAEAPSR